MTSISTAARRITRHLNTLGQHWHIGFTADGHVDGHVHGQNVDLRELRDSYVILSTGRGRWTQDEVQFQLDVLAAADAAGNRSLVDILAIAWSVADEAGRPRPTVEEVIRSERQISAEMDAEFETAPCAPVRATTARATAWATAGPAR